MQEMVSGDKKKQYFEKLEPKLKWPLKQQQINYV